MIYRCLYAMVWIMMVPYVMISRRLRTKYLPTVWPRLGFQKLPHSLRHRESIWIHAVSVGEALAVKGLVQQLRVQFPHLNVILTVTTTTGFALARQEVRAHAVLHSPYDFRFSVMRMIRALEPCVCLFVESEFWPGFTREVQKRGIPLLLINGRVSDRSFPRYRRVRWLIHPVLKRFDRMCVQSSLDAERLLALGANPNAIVVTGNLKVHSDQFQVRPESAARVDAILGSVDGSPLFVAGSTHEGEEKMVMDAFQRAGKREPNLRLVLAPRKPHRFDAVARWLCANGIRFDRTSRLNGLPARESVILVDELGLLLALYRRASVAFVGGSLVPRGGHNLMEAVAAGIPTLFGPHMENFRALAEDARDWGAGIVVKDEHALGEQVLRFLADENARIHSHRAAVRLLQHNGQARQLTLSEIRQALEPAGETTQWVASIAQGTV